MLSVPTDRFSEVHFRHRRTGRHDEAERAFGCPVRFGQAETLGVFPLSALWIIPRFANRSIAEHVEKFVAALCVSTARHTTICESAQRSMRSLLASGVRASSASVARMAGITNRTLQRKLAEEGTSFRELRDATLWDAVEKTLSIPSLKIEVIALSVGFSDVAAFSKAFRRWKGCSPTRFRVILARSTGTPRAGAKRRSRTEAVPGF